MTRAWDKEKIWVPDRNWTNDLPNTGRALFPLSYENSWRARPFNWVLMWHASCILHLFSLSHARVIVDHFIFKHLIYRAENSPSLSFIAIHDDIDIADPNLVSRQVSLLPPFKLNKNIFHVTVMVESLVVYHALVISPETNLDHAGKPKIKGLNEKLFC